MKINIVAFGKAVLAMIRSAQELLGDSISSITASVPLVCGRLTPHVTIQGLPAHLQSTAPHLLPLAGDSVRIFEGARNNLPDEAALEAAKHILESVRATSEVYHRRRPHID